MPYEHIPVMQSEVIHYLNCRPGKIYVDCTLGGSGHAAAVCKKIIPGGLLIGIDQDKDAIQNAETILKPYQSDIRLFHDNFANLPKILSKLNIPAVDGIFIDLGISLQQLKHSGRGFSFQKDEQLDMRMNIDSHTTAKDLINMSEEKSLTDIFKKYGQERRARHIARKIVEARKSKAIETSKQLSLILCKAAGKRGFDQKIHPATRVFMAIRIAVNRELEMLDSFMENFADLLNPGGRLCVLSFHSLEDKIIKHRMKTLEKGCICPPDFPQCVCNKKQVICSLTKKVLRPTKDEIANNPMSRSAKLRAVEKL